MTPTREALQALVNQWRAGAEHLMLSSLAAVARGEGRDYDLQHRAEALEHCADALAAVLAAQQDEPAGLRAYAQHKPDCAVAINHKRLIDGAWRQLPCSCGLAAVLAGPEAQTQTEKDPHA